MRSSHLHDARHELVSAAAGYLGSWHWDYVHPENPYGDAQMELAESVLDRAVDEYVAARNGAVH